MNKRKKLRSYTKRHLRNLALKRTLRSVNVSDTSDSESSEPEPELLFSATDSLHSVCDSPHTFISDHLDSDPPSPPSNNNEHAYDSESSIPNSIDYRYSSSDSEEIELGSDADDNEDFFYDPVEEKHKKFISDIHLLVVQHNIDQTTTNNLLEILRNNTDTAFPKTYRTLLKTPRQTPTIQMEGGEYYHFGLEDAIKKMLEMQGSTCVSMSIILIY